MRLSVSLIPSIRPVDSSTDVAVVIDVLRATSVMTTALANGAAKFITCQQIDEARELAKQFVEPPLLCGERHCKPINGFDLGNSPSEYPQAIVSDRTLVLTTTNGTLAIAAAAAAKQMIVSSFLNLAATIEFLRNADSIHLVCAGTNGQITAEDVLLAGAIVEGLCNLGPVDFDDDAILAQELYRSWFGKELPTSESLAKRLALTQGGRNLVNVGYAADLNRCAAINSIAVVPQRVSNSPNTFALKAK